MSELLFLMSTKGEHERSFEERGGSEMTIFLTAEEAEPDQCYAMAPELCFPPRLLTEAILQSPSPSGSPQRRCR